MNRPAWRERRALRARRRKYLKGTGVRFRFHHWRGRRRFAFADFLNRFRRFCWCTLVDWALEADPDRRPDPGENHGMLMPRRNFPRPMLFTGSQTTSCEADAAKVGTCYCAKFRTLEAQTNMGLQGGFLVDEVTR